MRNVLTREDGRSANCKVQIDLYGYNFKSINASKSLLKTDSGWYDYFYYAKKKGNKWVLWASIEMSSRVHAMKLSTDDGQVTFDNLNFKDDIYYTLTNPNKSGGGCYIATAVYGNYDHPDVIILRKFRDNKLSKSLFGKQFIRIYYKYSPILANYLKSNFIISKIVKYLLERIIRLISK